MLPLKQLQAGCPAARRSHAPSILPTPSSCIAWLSLVSENSNKRRLYTTACWSSFEDAVSEAVDPRSRRMQRAERREARRHTNDSQQASSDDEQTVPELEAATGDEAPPARPSRLSKLAARRAQRSRAKRRVPAALVPDEDVVGDEDEDDEDDDLFVRSEPQHADDASDEAAVEEDEDGEGEDSPSILDLDSSSEPDRLPSSVLDAVVADRRISHQGASTSQPSSRGQQGRPDPVMLRESNPMYVPVLTDEDLDNDPPGHKSGYVAVIGKPNAGKSTLINAIVGQKLSIVTFKPQTTRHRVVGIASAPAYQMILFDTPGIMNEQRNQLDERMMAAVVSSIKAAEVIIAVVDSGDSPQEALAMFQPGPDWSGPPMAVLLNKTDLLADEQTQQLVEWYKNNCRAEQVFVGSALSSDDAGVAAIKAWAVDKLPEGPTLYPKSMVSEQPERFFVSEMIREQIFLQYDKEIPYSSQVVIDDFKEWPGKKDHIKALILVERESQAPILLGKGGSKIKRLGSAARAQIEEFLGRPVYLELSVKVAPSWRQQSDKLKDFGYFDPLYIT